MFKVKIKEDENIYNSLPTLNLNDNLILCKFKEVEINFEMDEDIQNFDDFNENKGNNEENNNK